MDASKAEKRSPSERGGKVIIGAFVVLVGGIWLALGLTTWGERPLRGLGFTVLALGAAVAAGLLWGRMPERTARHLRRLAYGLVFAAAVLIGSSYFV